MTKEKWINGTSAKFETFFYFQGYQKVKRQPAERENIFAGHISDKRVEYRIYKESLKLKKKRQRT